ncbi:MAG: hypothetical protein GY868_10375 [Deltaproteobacteria bacterium]|nr:hypothetical protein [Deltaproteobacteria bacterium]
MEEKIIKQIFEKVSACISLKPVPEFEELATVKAIDGRKVGSVSVYQGDKIERYTFTDLSLAPGMNYFSITIRPTSMYNIPKLGINYMQTPDQIQFDVDLYPAVDLVPRQEYVDKYYDLLKETFLQAKSAPYFSWRVSDHSWMRVNASPYFFMSRTDIAHKDLVDLLVQAYLDVWLKIHAEAQAVSEEEARLIASRRSWLDRWLREREPDRHVIVKIFGEELTNKMSDAMI